MAENISRVMKKKKIHRLPSSAWSAALHAKKPVALATGNQLAAELQGQLREKKKVNCCRQHFNTLYICRQTLAQELITAATYNYFHFISLINLLIIFMIY